MSDKIATALFAVMIGIISLTCLAYGSILIMPEVAFNPYPPSDATTRASLTEVARNPKAFSVPETSTNTPGPVWEPTWTPTNTPTPTLTNTPTETRTPTPTGTPSPTRTPFPTATSTSTGTPLPTATATITPPPLYSIAGRQTEPNCHVVRVKGLVSGSDGLPLSGVSLQVGEVGLSPMVAGPTDGNGRYVFDFGSPDDKNHRWFVIPLENGQRAYGVQPFEFETHHISACDLTDSVQIVTVNWRRRP